MDDLVDPSSTVADNIAKIDQLFDQHRHQKLFELVNTYNNEHPENPIEYNDNDGVIEFIIYLWCKHVQIPPELTFGEPAPDGWA